MVREVKTQGGVRRTRKNSELPRSEEVVNGRCSFTTRELLCFMHKESLVQYTEIGRIRKTRFSDVTVEWLLSTAGLNKEQLEERMVQAAFDAFTPGRPVIPSERYMMVLSSRRTVELGKAYNLNWKLPWTTLRGQLNMKRREIIIAYRDSLLTETGMYCSEHALAPMGKLFQSNLNNSTVNSQAVSGPSRASFVEPTSRVPIFHPAPRHHEPVSGIKDHHLPAQSSHIRQKVMKAQDTTGKLARKSNPTPKQPQSNVESVSIPLAQTKAPTFVNTRRKKLGVPRNETHSRHSFVRKGKEALDVWKGTTGDCPHYNHMPTTGMMAKSGNATGEAEEAVAQRNVSRLTLSTLTNVYDALQLAPSPERQGERPRTYEEECEDWSADGEFIVDASAQPSGSRPVENSTLRKLAELRNRLAQEKLAGVRDQQQVGYDLLTSPDSDFFIDDAFRSPRHARPQCAFTFRGYRIEAPATAERAQRRRRPIWYVREDPGSPTPIRTTLPLPQPNVFCQEDPAPPPVLTSSCPVYDDENILDMDLTEPLALATPLPRTRHRTRRKPRQ